MESKNIKRIVGGSVFLVVAVLVGCPLAHLFSTASRDVDELEPLTESGCFAQQLFARL